MDEIGERQLSVFGSRGGQISPLIHVRLLVTLCNGVRNNLAHISLQASQAVLLCGSHLLFVFYVSIYYTVCPLRNCGRLLELDGLLIVVFLVFLLLCHVV